MFERDSNRTTKIFNTRYRVKLAGFNGVPIHVSSTIDCAYYVTYQGKKEIV